jgi:hypothetical protein
VQTETIKYLVAARSGQWLNHQSRPDLRVLRCKHDGVGDLVLQTDVPLLRNGSVFGDYDANVSPSEIRWQCSDQPRTCLIRQRSPKARLAVPPSPDFDRNAVSISCFLGVSVATWANALLALTANLIPTPTSRRQQESQV